MDLKVFNKQTYSVMSETVAQQVEKFNAASRGSIVLRNKPNQGDFAIEAAFKAIAGLVRRRDAYGTGAVSPVALEHLQNASVKVAAGTPPIEFKPSDYHWIQANPELAAIKIGEQLAKAQLQDMLNTAVRALTAAISGQVGLVHDGTAAKASFAALNTGAAKFGDRSASLVAWIIHSKALHDLYDNALTNSANLFQFGTVNVVSDAFGRLFVVTDSPALFVDAATDNYLTLGLAEGAALVDANEDFNAVLVNTVGDENIKTTYQAEWSFNVGVKGYTWDMAAGGKSPTDVALGTATNWDKTASDVKDTAGVLVKTL